MEGKNNKMKTRITAHEWGFIYSSLKSLIFDEEDDADEKAYNEKIESLLVKINTLQDKEIKRIN